MDSDIIYKEGDRIEFKTDDGLKVMTIDRVGYKEKDEYTREIIKYFGKCDDDNRLWQSPHKAVTRQIT